MFKLEHNHEVYCFMKLNLPEGFTIEADPSPYYFTEDYFWYTVRKDGVTIDSKHGKFSELERGELIVWGKLLLYRIIKEERNENSK